MNLSKLPKEKLIGILNAISRLKQKVIIKWVPDKSIKLPHNVKVGSWLPQNDILGIIRYLNLIENIIKNIKHI